MKKTNKVKATTLNEPTHHDNMVALIKSRASKIKAKHVLALLVLCVVAFCLPVLGVAAGASKAVLYLWANNGKMSGRMGGDVKMRNGRSRGFTVPSLVRNTFTSTVRALFQGFSSSYKSLTLGQIYSWVNATGFTYIDRFAQSHVLKGKALYMRLNLNLAKAGQAPITTAPSAQGVSPVLFTDASTISVATGISLDFDPTVPTGHTVVVYATPGISRSILRPGNSLFKQVTTFAAGTTSPQTTDITTAYGARGLAYALAQFVWFRFETVNNATGEASAIAETSVRVDA